MSDLSNQEDATSEEPQEQEVVLELTPEQQAVIRRASGQHARVIQITIPEEGANEGVGRALHFRWRISQATGIPRQAWDHETE